MRRAAGLVLISTSLLRAADAPVPDWARQAMAQTAPAYGARVSSVVLLSEENVTVEPDGRRVMRERGAVKALQNGAGRMVADRTYNKKAGRIRDFQAWLIPLSGKPTAFSAKQVVDVALSREDIYDETRRKLIDGGTVTPGTVFAWEVTEEEKTVFTQYWFGFQSDAPVLTSRFAMTVPPGWEVKSQVLNHTDIAPQVAGNSYTWELQNLPPIEREDYSPAFSELAARLAVGYFPPSGNAAGLQGLKDWTSVSMWVSQFVDPAAEVTPAIRAKAAQLTANASDDTAKIRAIAEFAQNTTYVEICINVTRGGGYTPHRADETLARNYGDCKDKATLMRALLKAIGIESYVTVIRSGNRDFVKPEWASPTQFDHAIIAVKVTDSVNLPTVFEHPVLGRLMMFDPTDPFTQMGGLPLPEQGSNALILAGDKGTLTKMPLLSPEANRMEGVVKGSIDAEGRMQASVQREYFGHASVMLRALERESAASGVRRVFERAFNRSVGRSRLTEITTAADNGQNHATVKINMEADHFGQNMGGKLLIVRPGLLTSGGNYYLVSNKRNNPVKLEADLRRDTIRIKVPAGFKLDELPQTAKIDGAYGRLEATWAVENGEIVMNQTLEVRQTTVPAAEYESVRKFFDRLGGAQAAPVVLTRQ